MDPSHPQLDRALHLLNDGNAKIDFLIFKVEQKLTELEDDELAHKALYPGVSLLEQKKSSTADEEKVAHLLGALLACRDKCSSLRGRIQGLTGSKALVSSSTGDLTNTTSEFMPKSSRLERMAMELILETRECCICTDAIRRHNQIWSCRKCYNIFHLECAKEWRDRKKLNGLWPCPYCRQPLNVSGFIYRCCCGRVIEPKSLPNTTPHTCGQRCARNCGRLCHPGPCPV